MQDNGNRRPSGDLTVMLYRFFVSPKALNKLRQNQRHNQFPYSDYGAGTLPFQSGTPRMAQCTPWKFASPVPDQLTSLRRATPQDQPLLMKLIAEFCLADGHPFDAQRIASALQPLLDNDKYGAVYVIAPDRGYAVLTWGYSLESGGKEALIDELFVRERGQGIGSRVLEQLRDEARLRGVKKIFLETERPNTAARRFYQRAGFTEDDSIWLSDTL